MIRRSVLLGLALLPLLTATAAFADERWPNQPITIIVPATPGGAIDLTARLISAKMTAAWGVPVAVLNKGGAAGILGTDVVAKAKPDGYTLVLVASSHAINPNIYKKLPFDTVKSFEPVALTHVVPLMLAVSPSVPAKSVPDLVSWLKGMHGNVSYGSSGLGGAPHMSAELFKSMTKVEAVHVPYKGSTAAHPDLVSGRLAFMFDTVPALAPQVTGGRLKVLAVTTAKRSSAFPDVPTMQEAGINGYETSSWGGILAPAGTPKEIVAKLNGEINDALASPDVKEKLAQAGIEPANQSPKQFADFIVSEMKRWGEVAKSAGIQPD